MNIKCINCGKKTNRNNNYCEHCGYNINNFLISNNLTQTYNVFICPECGSIDAGRECPYLKCINCGHVYVASNMSRNKYWELLFQYINEGTEVDFKKEFVKSQVGDTIDWEAYQKNQIGFNNTLNKTISKPTPQSSHTPKCPTCGSTNIQKISATKKAAGAIGFGLFSKTAKSQFECKNCGYKW